MACGLSCPAACAIFLDQGLNLFVLHWQADSLPLSNLGSLWLDTNIVTNIFTLNSVNLSISFYFNVTSMFLFKVGFVVLKFYLFKYVFSPCWVFIVVHRLWSVQSR